MFHQVLPHEQVVAFSWEIDGKDRVLAQQLDLHLAGVYALLESVTSRLATFLDGGTALPGSSRSSCPWMATVNVPQAGSRAWRVFAVRS